MAQIVNMILDELVKHLQTEMQVNVDAGDLTYADVVKKGLLQEDKTKKNVSLGITGGDHEDPEYVDAIVSLDKLPDIGFYLAAREIGGGQMWHRRGVIRVECYFIRERLLEDEAFAAGYEILGRVQSNVENLNVTGLIDDFGERAIKMFSHGNTFFESGGGQRSFIFRGKVFWTCLTERP